MESPALSPQTNYVHMYTSRPSIGFPLGTALLLIVIFSLSGIVSCCYHLNRFRLRRYFGDEDDPYSYDLEASKANPTQDMKPNQGQSLPVLMPGDEVPKFIAMPCPNEPPMDEKIEIKVEKPTKPPRTVMPFY